MSHSLPLLPDIQVVNEMFILGVMFNSKLTWSTHIDYIIKKCSRLLFAFRTIRTTIPSPKLKLLYFSLVRSLIEYFAPRFSCLSSYDAQRLEKLQRRFHRLSCSTDCMPACLPALSDRRLSLALRFLQVILRDESHILHSRLPSRSRRGRFILPPRRTEKRSKSFFLSTCERYNLLRNRHDLPL